MKTKTLSIEKLATIAKPFIGSLRGKTVSRPILKTALVNEKYVIATDSHVLIRIEHGKTVNEPYLHHYKQELTQDCELSRYPDVSRLVPLVSDAQKQPLVNIEEWIEAHELALIAAKQTKNCVVTLQENKILVKSPSSEPNFNEIAFNYTFDETTEIEKISYSCEYMLMALKAIKKLGHKEVVMNFYGHHRPLYFVAGNVEILVMPVRTF